MQLRWASVGRAVAIAAAVIAAIAGLPALLGSDRPPPVPADVGLATVDPTDVWLPPDPAPVSDAAAARTPSSAYAKPSPKPAKRRPAKGGRPERHARRRGGERAERRPGAAAPAPSVQAVSPAYLPAPSYSPPSVTGEFRFER
jgi:hypothetical protein